MSSTVEREQPLLATDDRASSTSTHKKKLLIAFGLVSALILIGCLLCVPRGQAKYRFISMPLSPMSAAGAAGSDLRGAVLGPTNVTDLTSSAVSMHCLRFTGGTCNFQACKVYREATCVTHNFIQHHCDCSTGCVGADFGCHPAKYELASTGFTLTNVHYTNSHLKFPTDNAILAPMLEVEDASTGVGHMFSLYRVTGVNKDGLKRYMFGSVSSPGHAIAIAEIDTSNGIFYQGAPTYSPLRPDNMFWMVCKPKGGTGVQIGINFGDYTFWLSVSSVSSYVQPWSDLVWGKPDGRGQWTSDSNLDGIDDVCP